MRVFLRCLGAALVSKGLRALIGEIPFVGVLCEIGEDACQRWKESQQKAPIQEELQQAASASREKMQAEVVQIVGEVAVGQPPAVREALTAYLTQVPATIRRTFTRPEDPSGTTVPCTFTLRSSKDLVPLLPARLPRFKPGDQPLPGVPWQLTKLLGVGGFGEVWKASHTKFKGIPPVALKFCLDPSAATSLRHEAALLDQVMRQGIGKGIVPLRNAYLDTDPICLEYEYVEGVDLTGLIQHIAKLPTQKRIERARQIIRFLAEVVGRMHRLSPPVIHRDLKPANVLARRMAEGGWQLLVADFGIGAVVAEKQVQGERYGTTSQSDLLATMAHGSCTPLYASPQQKAGERADPRDDVHALGVMWYQLLLGDPTKGIAADYAEDLRELGLEDAEIRLLGSCVAANPVRRPASAADLAERISQVEPKQKRTASSVVSSPNPAVFGQAITFTATVTRVPPATGTPTGTVTFKDGAVVLGSETLSNGTATLTTTALSAGDHGINVAYAGDALFPVSTSSPPLTQSVTPAPLTVTVAEASKVCGQDNPAFAATYSGFVNSETPESLGGTLTFSTPATADSPSGSYAVTPGGLTSNNYSITFVPGILTVQDLHPNEKMLKFMESIFGIPSQWQENDDGTHSPAGPWYCWDNAAGKGRQGDNDWLLDVVPTKAEELGIPVEWGWWQSDGAKGDLGESKWCLRFGLAPVPGTHQELLKFVETIFGIPWQWKEDDGDIRSPAGIWYCWDNAAGKRRQGDNDWLWGVVPKKAEELGIYIEWGLWEGDETNGATWRLRFCEKIPGVGVRPGDSFPVVQTWEEIEDNLRLLEGYLQSSNNKERDSARDLVRKAKTIIISSRGGRKLVGPSRFVGYADNTLEKHEANFDKHGGKTNHAIAKLLGQQAVADPALEAEYQDFCRTHGIQNISRVKRKYWRVR